jgi:hypothetical protein
VGIEDDNLFHARGVRVDRMNMQVAKPVIRWYSCANRISPRRNSATWRCGLATCIFIRSTLLRRGDILFAQEYHLMTQHRVIQLLKLVVAQRTG